jgi:hypothetical protein
MSAPVRAIQLPSATALSSVAQRLRAALAPWVSEWTLGGGTDSFAGLAVDARCVDDEAALRAAEFQTVRTKTGTLWIRRTAADAARLGRAVVGDAMMPRGSWADDWVADVIEHAWAARNRAIASALLEATPDEGTSPLGALPSGLFAFGAGSVYCSCDALGLHLVADQSIWRLLPPNERTPRARGRLTPIDEAARGAGLRIEVVLGTVELDLSKVLDLRCGDVLRLPQCLDEGLSILCEGHPVARAALGERRGRKCVQLTTPSANA